MAEIQTVTEPQPDSADIVVSGKKQKIPHYDSGKAPTVRDAVIGQIGGGSRGLVGDLTRWVTTEVIDATRGGDMTPDMAGRVQSWAFSKLSENKSTSSVFNAASGIAIERGKNIALNATGVGGLAVGAVEGVSGAVLDEKKFVSNHKEFIAEMAERGVPGYEHTTTTRNGKTHDIYVDASGTAQYPGAEPIVYGGGGKYKESAENLSDKASTDVDHYVQDHCEENIDADGNVSLVSRDVGADAYKVMVGGKLQEAALERKPPENSPSAQLVMNAPAPAAFAAGP